MRALEGWTFRGVYIAPSWVKEIARQLDWRSGGRLFFRQSNEIDDAAWSTMDRVFRTLSSPHSRLEAEAALLTSLRLVFGRFGDMRPSASRIGEGGKRIAKVKDYVKNRYRDDISFNKLAAVGGLSPYYLIHCFRKAFGLPPHASQLQVRLQRAKADLKSDTSLAQIAISTASALKAFQPPFQADLWHYPPPSTGTAISYKTIDADSRDIVPGTIAG